LPHDNQLLLDLAFDYARAGLYWGALEILEHTDQNANDGSVPIVLYALGHFHETLGNAAAASAVYSAAAKASPDYCFPSRLEELIILQAAVAGNPMDSRAAYYLGNLLYDRRRHREAIELWEQSAHLDPSFSVVWRNLGIAYFNVLGDAEKARPAFDRAIQVNPEDARVLYERDQLWKRTGETPENRLREFETFAELVRQRDDASVELARLYNQTRQPEKALALLRSRKFQPWEGGEGLALGQHARTHLELGRRALGAGKAREAQRFFEMALSCPENLGEATHPLANQSDIFYWLGIAADVAGDDTAARRWWERAAQGRGDFQHMSVKSFSEMTYYNALALRRLWRPEEAEKLLRDLLRYAEALAEQPVKIDYFATSLPAMLLFEDDLKKRNRVTATFLQAQARLGLGEIVTAQELLGQVLRLDRNHALAADLLVEIEATPAVV
jgi:tetratricopeptide (TPR) repeat protein